MGVPIASDALSYAEGAISAGYSRHHEDQADRLVLNGLVRLGYDPREAPQVWKVLVSKIPSTPQFFWASHENNITRRSYLMAEIRINYPDINYSEVKLNREAYQEIVQLVQESKKRKRK